MFVVGGEGCTVVQWVRFGELYFLDFAKRLSPMYASVKDLVICISAFEPMHLLVSLAFCKSTTESGVILVLE